METIDYKVNADTKILKNIKAHKIDLPIYRCSVKIVSGEECKKLAKYWNKDLTGYGGETIDFLNEYREVLICFTSEKPHVSDVVHELTHAAQLIMSNIGHNHSKDVADEPFAYLVTYLIDMIYGGKGKRLTIGNKKVKKKTKVKS